MSFIYDGYQESVLSAVSKNFFADQSYSVIEMTVVLHPAFLTKISKRNFDEAHEYSIEKMEKKRDEFYCHLKNIAEIGR